MALDWLQFNIYVQDVWMLDPGVTHVIGPTVDKFSSTTGENRWFFIRYLDETGPHLRLRFLVDEEVIPDMLQDLADDLNERLESCPSVENTEQKRLLPFPTAGIQFQSYTKRVEMGLYDPEIEKYGGDLGIQWSEQLFHISSELALAAMRLCNNSEINRFSLAIQLMDLLLRTNGKSIGAFLQNYVRYWSGDQYRPSTSVAVQLMNAASRRAQYTQNIVDEPLHPSLRLHVDQYTNCMERAFEDLRAKGASEQQWEGILFHYIHMMNNRIGVWPIEEAYLAALLIAANTLHAKETGTEV